LGWLLDGASHADLHTAHAAPPVMKPVDAMLSKLVREIANACIVRVNLAPTSSQKTGLLVTDQE
jgi:hypothetical protein